MSDTQPENAEPLLGTRTVSSVAGLSLAVLGGLLFLVPPITAVFSAYLFFTMALITLTDLRHFIIPDVLSLPAIPIGLMASAFHHPDGDWLAGVTSGLAGAAIGGSVFYLLRAAYFGIRRIEGLGLGDVKLAAVAGAWLGPAALAPACLAATLAAIAGVLLHAVFSGHKTPQPRQHVPFGSFIAPTMLAFWIGKVIGLVHFW